MKKLLPLFVVGTLLLSCSKNDSNNSSGGACAAGSNVCFTLNGQTVTMDTRWIELVGSRMSIQVNSSAYGLSFDMGTLLETRTYSIENGSLWSGSARISFTDKATGKNYTATGGSVTITSVANSQVTGSFTTTLKDNATGTTYAVTDGKIAAVPKQ